MAYKCLRCGCATVHYADCAAVHCPQCHCNWADAASPPDSDDLHRQLAEAKADCLRQQRLLNAKDDALTLLYDLIACGTITVPKNVQHAIELGYGMAEIEASKARGENPYFAGTTEAGLHDKIAAQNRQLDAYVAALESIASHDEGLLGGSDKANADWWHDYIRAIVNRMQEKARAAL